MNIKKLNTLINKHIKLITGITFGVGDHWRVERAVKSKIESKITVNVDIETFSNTNGKSGNFKIILTNFPLDSSSKKFEAKEIKKLIKILADLGVDIKKGLVSKPTMDDSMTLTLSYPPEVTESTLTNTNDISQEEKYDWYKQYSKEQDRKLVGKLVGKIAGNIKFKIGDFRRVQQAVKFKVENTISNVDIDINAYRANNDRTSFRVMVTNFPVSSSTKKFEVSEVKKLIKVLQTLGIEIKKGLLNKTVTIPDDNVMVLTLSYPPEVNEVKEDLFEKSKKNRMEWYKEQNKKQKEKQANDPKFQELEKENKNPFSQRAKKIKDIRSLKEIGFDNDAIIKMGYARLDVENIKLS